MRIFATHKEWLDYYYELYGSFRVQLFQHRPNPWLNYGSKEYLEFENKMGCLPNHREKMVDEIIIDVDGEPKDNKKLLQLIVKKLEEDKWTFYAWYSGGFGYHIHMFFPELRTRNQRDREELKKLLKTHVTKGVNRPKDLKSHVCGANPVLFQCEKALHRKGFVKELIFKNELGENRIPQRVYEALKKEKETNKLNNEQWKLVANGETPKYIKFFLAGDDFRSIGDGRYRAMFLLTSYYLKKGIDKEEVYLKIKEWNSYQLRDYFDDYKIRSMVFQNHSRYAGYPFAKDLLRELGRNDVL